MAGRERVMMREKRLYQVSVDGNVESLNELINEDALILARASITCFDETPLHIASMLGHLKFAELLLSYKPDLVIELDSKSCSPLHLASANGYVEIVKKLLSVNPDTCLLRDEEGRTPLHLATMKGRIDVINELIRARPEAVEYKIDHGKTLLHLAVKHNRFGALKLLIEMGGAYDLLNLKDDDGNTILHLAAALKQLEMMKYLLNRNGVKVNGLNGNGFTALDIIERSPKDFKSMEIRETLLTSGALRAKNIVSPSSMNGTNQVLKGSEIFLTELNHEDETVLSQVSNTKKPVKQYEQWLKRKSDTLMVAASVIAAMAYETGLSPPGGYWQDGIKDPKNKNQLLHTAGSSVMAGNYPGAYVQFCIFNTISFISSLSVLLLLLSGLPLKKKDFHVDFNGWNVDYNNIYGIDLPYITEDDYHV